MQRRPQVNGAGFQSLFGKLRQERPDHDGSRRVTEQVQLRGFAGRQRLGEIFGDELDAAQIFAARKLCAVLHILPDGFYTKFLAKTSKLRSIPSLI